MKLIRIATFSVLALTFLSPTLSFAVDCKLPNKEKPELKFTNLTPVPKHMKSRKTPPKLSRQLEANNPSRRLKARDGGKETADAEEVSSHLDIMCKDWIMLCTDGNCNHGVAECDGQCIQF